MQSAGAPPYERPDEYPIALVLAALVLVALSVAKTLGGVPYLGQALLTGAAFMQLYLPVTRADRWGAPLSSVGLRLDTWRREAWLAAKVLALILPPYAVLYHLFLTRARALLSAYAPKLAWYVPHAQFAPHAPIDAAAWGIAVLWLCERVLTHTLGVALPEEVFYRGYLQPALQARHPATRQLWGAPFGLAVVLASALFALGHFLGEWNPLRFGPFIPGLLFGWLRNRTDTVMAAIAVHAGCNIFVELFSRLYI